VTCRHTNTICALSLARLISSRTFWRRSGTALAVLAALLWVRGHWRYDRVDVMTLREDSLSRRNLTLCSSRGRLYIERAILWHGDPTTFLSERAHYATFGMRNDRIVRWTRNKPCDLPQSEYGQAPSHRWGFLWDHSVRKARLGPKVFETTSFIVPYWALTGLAALVPAVFLAIRVRHMLWSHLLSRRGLCVRCGYDVRATPGRCPECGTEVDAALAGTPSVARPSDARAA